jgi:hypothetical protein
MRVRRASRLAGGLAMATTAVGVIALLSGGGGCELAVTDSVPFFTCLPDAADACPSGSVCVPATHLCVARSGTCTPGAANACGLGMRCDAQTLHCLPEASPLDATADVDAKPAAALDSTPDSSDVVVGDAPREGPIGDAPELDVPEVSADGPLTCHGDIGCGCSGASDCPTGICVNNVTLTPALYAAVGIPNDTNVCTKPCCTSADCTSGTVCFGTGAGGNYCVPSKWIGRNGGVGTGVGGASCSAATDCYSGLCSMGKCADTCCSTAQQSTECATGTVCRFVPFPGKATVDTHVTAWCGAAIGGTASGMICAVDNVCQSGKCDVGTCESACRTSTDCATRQACSYGLAPTLPTNSDIIEGCMPVTGTTANGGSCTSNSDCLSAFCDGTMHCADVCATDADCKMGLHCRPTVVKVQGSYSVLACGS